MIIDCLIVAYCTVNATGEEAVMVDPNPSYASVVRRPTGATGDVIITTENSCYGTTK